MISVETTGFAGPTLAAASLSFLMPLIKPKQQIIEGHEGLIATSKGDANLMPVLWICVLLFLFGWTWSCYSSMKLADIKIFGVTQHIAIGGVMYGISLILTGIKEKV